jgi:hypothetical protein
MYKWKSQNPYYTTNKDWIQNIQLYNRDRFQNIQLTKIESRMILRQKILFFSIAEGDAKIFEVFCVKNHDFTTKKSYFSQF